MGFGSENKSIAYSKNNRSPLNFYKKVLRDIYDQDTFRTKMYKKRLLREQLVLVKPI